MKMPKNGQIDEFLTTLSLRLNSVTRYVTKDKNGKFDSLGDFTTLCQWDIFVRIFNIVAFSVIFTAHCTLN